MIMRMSEAIFLGSTMRPQAFGILFAADTEGGATCAHGAALEAIGQRDKGRVNCAETWPWLENLGNCPACKPGEFQKPYVALISHLNDHHRWPRERTASWVALVEPKQPSVSQPAPEEDLVYA